MPDSNTMRLNKYLAFHLGVSRRKADELIEQGSVTVDGAVAEIGARVTDASHITVRGKSLVPKTQHTYLALHKPAQYVCSRKQQGDTPTIYAILPTKYRALKPVGRLDANSSGLLLLTDDGDFAQEMTHPQYYKQKRYRITLDSALQPLHQQMINDFGVQLEDGPSKLFLEKDDDSRSHWTVTMSEGRNRQIRRTFAALGYTVTKLHRFEFGNYTLQGLKSGAYQALESPYARKDRTPLV